MVNAALEKLFFLELLWIHVLKKLGIEINAHVGRLCKKFISTYIIEALFICRKHDFAIYTTCLSKKNSIA